MEVLYNNFEDNKELKELLSLYKSGSKKYAVLFYQSMYNPTYKEIIKFEKNKNNLVIIENTITYFVNKNGTLFRRKKESLKVIISKGRFYVKTQNKIRPYIRSNNSIIDKYIETNYPKFNFLIKNNIYISYNYVINNKLYGLTKLLKFLFKTDKVTSRKLFDHYSSIRNIFSRECIYIWNKYKHLFTHTQNLNSSLLSHHSFYSMCHLSFIYKRKINLSWSHKRLVNETKKLNRFHSFVMEIVKQTKEYNKNEELMDLPW